MNRRGFLLGASATIAAAATVTAQAPLSAIFEDLPLSPFGHVEAGPVTLVGVGELKIGDIVTITGVPGFGECRVIAVNGATVKIDHV